jgi:DNA-binding YbaB/EbfC family protein
MFDKLGQFAGIMKNLSRLQEEFGKLRERLGQLTATGDAGAGMVSVTVNGRLEVVGCHLSDEAMKANDREMLEDLFRAAANQALEKARSLVAEETSKAASELGLPTGMGLPRLD